MPTSQSNLSSLASLLENAEARHTSSLPPPGAVVDANAGSGLIDLEAIQKRARDERAAAAAAKLAERTPVPVVTTMPGLGPNAARLSASTDPEILAAMASTQRRKKHVLIGAITGGVALLALAIGMSFSGSSRVPAPAAAAAVAPPPPVVSPPVTPAPPPAPPPVVAETHAAEPVALATSAKADAAHAKGKKAKRKGHAAAKGPKMTKVTSGGT